MNEQELARLVATLEHLKHPFDRKQISKLPATDKRPALDYVNHAHVTNRLNQYAPDCSWVVDEMFTQNGECWIRGTMTIYGASRVEFGKGKNPLEAMSHFIRRAAMRFGVATDLWAKEDFEELDAPVVVYEDQREVYPEEMSTAAPVASGPGLPVGENTQGEGVTQPTGSPTLTGAATDEQWERLVHVSGGSTVRAVNRLNKVNGTAYTKTTAREGATVAEVAAAITGDAA